jgi:hypothetical protein
MDRGRGGVQTSRVRRSGDSGSVMDRVVRTGDYENKIKDKTFRCDELLA